MGCQRSNPRSAACKTLPVYFLSDSKPKGFHTLFPPLLFPEQLAQSPNSDLLDSPVVCSFLSPSSLFTKISRTVDGPPKKPEGCLWALPSLPHPLLPPSQDKQILISPGCSSPSHFHQPQDSYSYLKTQKAN